MALQVLNTGAHVSGQNAVNPEASELLLNAAHNLHVSGQDTEETLQTVAALSKRLSVRNDLVLGWDALTVQTGNGVGDTVLIQLKAVPSSVAMNRVEAINLALDKTDKGLTSIRDTISQVVAAEQLASATLWLFVLACAVGASALSLIFGAVHIQAIAMIAGSAAAGALLRRLVGHFGGGVILQALVASLLAGLLGAFAVKLQVSSELRLVAVCPCMILVPGPHILNGALDLTYLRIPLGLSRLLFAILILIAICTGVLLGLDLGGSSLPVDGPSRHIALWLDVLAAGTAAASYGIYFSTPLYMLIWPVLTGMIAHAARWWVMSAYGFSAPAGAGVACVIVAVVLTPIASRRKLPFAAVGFASVVSLMPGVFIFRMSSGLVALYQHASAVTPQTLVQTFSDAMMAIAIILYMGLGLVLPKRLYGAFAKRRSGWEARNA